MNHFTTFFILTSSIVSLSVCSNTITLFISQIIQLKRIYILLFWNVIQKICSSRLLIILCRPISYNLSNLSIWDQTSFYNYRFKSKGSAAAKSNSHLHFFPPHILEQVQFIVIAAQASKYWNCFLSKSQFVGRLTFWGTVCLKEYMDKDLLHPIVSIPPLLLVLYFLQAFVLHFSFFFHFTILAQIRNFHIWGKYVINTT